MKEQQNDGATKVIWPDEFRFWPFSGELDDDCQDSVWSAVMEELRDTLTPTWFHARSAEKEGDEWHRRGIVTAQHAICRGSEKREKKEEKGQTAGGRRVGTGDGNGGMTFEFSSLIIVGQVFMLTVNINFDWILCILLFWLNIKIKLKDSYAEIHILFMRSWLLFKPTSDG